MCNKGSVHPNLCCQSDLNWWAGSDAWVNRYYRHRGRNSVNVSSNKCFVCMYVQHVCMYRQEKPSLPSVTAAHVCQLILIISSVQVCGHSDVHARHMFQKHVLVLVSLLLLPWAPKNYVQHDCIRRAPVNADSGIWRHLVVKIKISAMMNYPELSSNSQKIYLKIKYVWQPKPM